MENKTAGIVLKKQNFGEADRILRIFTYAVNLGCFWKTAMMLVLFVVTLGGPMYYNTRFAAEHGEDGASVKMMAAVSAILTAGAVRNLSSD